MLMKVCAPKWLRKRTSMLCVAWWAMRRGVSPFMRRCTSMARLLPMRRVRKLWGSETPGSWWIICRMTCSSSAGSDFSSNSWMLGMNNLNDTRIIKMLTTTAAIGSSTCHWGPKMIAPPMPIAVPMLDRASLRWCQALATTADESTRCPTRAVH